MNCFVRREFLSGSLSKILITFEIVKNIFRKKFNSYSSLGLYELTLILKNYIQSQDRTTKYQNIFSADHNSYITLRRKLQSWQISAPRLPTKSNIINELFQPRKNNGFIYFPRCSKWQTKSCIISSCSPPSEPAPKFSLWKRRHIMPLYPRIEGVIKICQTISSEMYIPETMPSQRKLAQSVCKNLETCLLTRRGKRTQKWKREVPRFYFTVGRRGRKTNVAEAER